MKEGEIVFAGTRAEIEQSTDSYIKTIRQALKVTHYGQ